LGNVACAAVNSRITSVRTVEIHGARPDDQPRLAAIVGELQGVPFVRIHWRALETAVLREPSVRAVDFTRNPFGKADLWVAYRKPVARLQNRPNIGLDETGVLFAAPDIPRDLPTLKLPNGGIPTLITQAASWDAVRIARLAVDIRAFPGADGVGIEMDDRGVLCLNMSAGRVVLGSCDDMDKKLSVLKERLSQLSQVEELNLTRPDAPAAIPKSRAERPR
jgi:cell division septal protein FtsQ